jgi:hypothetical protein
MYVNTTNILKIKRLGADWIMSILQDPLTVLDQIEWYYNNKDKEEFHGAFFIASGNLCRQLIEQILFILAFYSGLPQSKYMKQDKRLKMADGIFNELKKINTTTGRTYFEEARLRGARIRKFAQNTRSLNKWRRLFNEPSHFRNPASKKLTKEDEIIIFVKKMRSIIDELDCHLITAAVNEIKSNGRYKAVLSNDDKNTPGIQFEVIVLPNNLALEKGRLGLKTPKFKYHVISDAQDMPNRWPKVPVLVQHSVGIAIQVVLRNKYGDPINITNTGTIIESLAKTEEDRKQISRHFKKLGVEIQWH